MIGLKKLSIAIAFMISASLSMTSIVKASTNIVADSSIHVSAKEGNVHIEVDPTDLQDVTTLCLKFQISPKISQNDMQVNFTKGNANIQDYTLQAGEGDTSILKIYLSASNDLFTDNTKKEVAILTQLTNATVSQTFTVEPEGLEFVKVGSQNTEQRESISDHDNVAQLTVNGTPPKTEESPESPNKKPEVEDNNSSSSNSGYREHILMASIGYIPPQTYTGKAIEPEVTIKHGILTLEKDRDYTVTYKNNEKVGIATAIIQGIGSYRGTVEKTFSIKKAPIRNLTYGKIANQAYTKKAVKPNVVVKNGTTTLKKGTDYTVTYKNNIKRGTATVVVKGEGNYTGTKKLTFKIVNAIKDAKVATIKAQTYTGKAMKPTIKVTYGKKTLKKGTDYTLTYKNNKKVGTATVVIKGKGQYAGTKTVKFKIVKKS